MIGLDTNVIVRYIAHDDAFQAAKAAELIESLSPENPGFVSVVALVEVVWVLQGAYQASRDELRNVLETLLRNRDFIVEHSEVVWKAVRAFAASKANFADCMIDRLANDAGCEYVATFDKDAAKLAGMRLIS